MTNPPVHDSLDTGHSASYSGRVPGSSPSFSPHSGFLSTLIERVWNRNRHILVGVVRSLLPDSAWAEDILQESLTRVLAARRRFQSEREAFNFIRRTVVNTSIEEFRRSMRQRRLGHGVSTWARQIQQTGPDDDPLGQMIREEENLRKRSLLSEIKNSLAALPGEQREAIDIIFGRSSRDRGVLAACKRRGLPYSTVRSRMLVGVERIRSDLRRRGIFEEKGRTNRESV